MRLDSEGLRELYQTGTARSARVSDDNCLTEDMLAGAAAGELNQSEREKVADHLVTCSDCAKEYLAIKSLKSWAHDEPANDSTPLIALPSSENGRRYRTNVDETPARSRTVSFYFPYAVAAAAVVLSLALGALLISKSRENQRLLADANNRQSTNNTGDSKTAEELAQSRRLLEETTRRAEQESAARRVAEEELARRDAAQNRNNQRSPERSTERSTPDVNVPIIDLNPEDAGRGGQNQTATTIQLPSDTDLFTLILNLSGDDSSQAYSLEVTDRNNRTIWTSRDLRKSPYNNFTVAMRRRLFPGGEYRLKIYGLRGGRRELIEEYAIRLLYQ